MYFVKFEFCKDVNMKQWQDYTILKKNLNYSLI